MDGGDGTCKADANSTCAKHNLNDQYQQNVTLSFFFLAAIIF